MIVTVTCNPALDRTVSAEGVHVNIGGKGINVAKVLRKLGVKALCTGFLGKDNGQIITDGLDELDIAHDFMTVEGKVRTNTKRIIAGELHEENEKGTPVNDRDIKRLKEYLKQFKDSIIAISGSAPPGIDEHFYGQLVSELKDNGNRVIMDCDRQLLANGIKASPDVIKPNVDELRSLYGIDDDLSELVDTCRKIPVGTIVLSRGSNGALFFIEGRVYECPALPVDYVSAVGAGDSMVAALAYAMEKHMDTDQTIRLAMAASAASVESKGSEAPEYGHIMGFMDKVVIKEVTL